MSTIQVDRSLSFKNMANKANNVMGNMSTDRVTKADYFTGKAIDGTNDYTVTVGGTADAIEVSGGGVPGFTALTGTADNDVCYIATPLVFDISQAPELEARIKIADISGCFVFVGFSDAITEATPNASMDADSGTLVAAATDVVGFVIDADKGTSSIYAASANTGAAVQSVDTGIDYAADNATHVLRVRLDTAGGARFFVDGMEKGYIAAAVADVPLCAMFNFGTRANDGANSIYVRYLKTWADCP